MSRTCHACKGHTDNNDNLKCCTGCQKVFYCSPQCQEDDRIRHIFDCKPRRSGITTADYLALAVHDNVFPEDRQTCEDYGFNRATTSENRAKLLGLYIGLIKHMGIPSKTIHHWQVGGVLVEEIKAAYSKIPLAERHRGGHFPWFLQNETVISSKPSSSRRTSHDHGAAMRLRAWRFIGGSKRDFVKDINTAMARKTRQEQDCLSLYTLLLSKLHPGPELDLWVSFGFASCRSQGEERELGGQYQKLIARCSFGEFCDAYCHGGLLYLFRSKGLQLPDDRYLQDILTGPGGFRKTVWHLKQFTQVDRLDMILSIVVDYGFLNCRDHSEIRQLKRVYKDFFATHDGDPLALHKACLQGNIHGFLSGVVKGLRDPKFQRLMENPYPLSGFRSSNRPYFLLLAVALAILALWYTV